MELVARYRGIGQLAQLAKLAYDVADLVVLPDRRTDGLVGNINAVDLLERLEYVPAQLIFIVLVGGLRRDEGNVHHAHEKVGVLLLDKTHDVEILMRPVHHLACFGREHGRQEVVAALHAALKNAARERAGLIGHVVCADVGVARAGGAQAHREAAAEVEQYLGDKIAGVAQRLFPIRCGLLDKLVVSFLKQILKVDEVL